VSDTITVTIEADELRLAQLACLKLAKLVQGTLSLGLPAMVTGIPEPRAFLEQQFRVMTPFALVLSAVSGTGTQEALHLREKSEDVSAALNDLQSSLFGYLNLADRQLSALGPARQFFSALCDSLAAYATLVRLDRAPIVKVQSVGMQVFDALGTLDTPRASSPV
jgi:hypothetical protein